jgi:hypothetical protein
MLVLFPSYLKLQLTKVISCDCSPDAMTSGITVTIPDGNRFPPTGSDDTRTPRAGTVGARDNRPVGAANSGFLSVFHPMQMRRGCDR